MRRRTEPSPPTVRLAGFGWKSQTHKMLPVHPHSNTLLPQSKQTMIDWASRVCAGGMFSCAVLFACAVMLLYLLLAPIALWMQGVAGLQPAAVAALISLIVGLGVLAVAHRFTARDKPLVSMLLSTAIRMIPLLVIGLVIALSEDKGPYLYFVGYLLWFYLATLAIETFVSIQLAQSRSASSAVTSETQR